MASKSRPAKPPRPIPPHPLSVIRRARDEFGVREVIVGVSGKDAACAIDLCVEHFDRVSAYFMYIVPGLSFQEKFLSYIERRYSISIRRIPHFGLAKLFRDHSFRYMRLQSIGVPTVKPRDVDAYLRKLTGLEWVATGEKAADSVERNAMIRRVGGIDTNRRRIFPIAFWSDAAVFNHLKTRSIALPQEYSQLENFTHMRSFGQLWWRDIAWIREKHPDDFDKIRRLFPLIDGQVTRYLERERREREKAEKENGKKEGEGG
jgi:phosphoadenosine phosphosulfate reductase